MGDGFSETELKSAIETVDAWHNAFANSREFNRLSHGHQLEAGAITEFFARYAYEHLGVSPNDWNRNTVVECCTDLLPRKVSAEPAFFEAVAPVLSAFFSFLDAQSILRHGRELAETVEKIANKIVPAASDHRSWGPAKTFVMAAQDAGVDIRDQTALAAFMLEFNMRQVGRAGIAGGSRPDSRSVSAQETDSHKPDFPPPFSRYDPCPCGSGKKYKFCCQRRM